MVFFRMDDITPGMNWERFLKFQAIFDQYQIQPLLGVVPCNEDLSLNVEEIRDDFWEKMRLLQHAGWLIAQHGYTHVYETCNGGMLNINARSEFSGLSYEKQYQKILMGKNKLLLEGIDSNIWMAPAHSYDKNTLHALVDLGFKYVTDGYSLRPYRQNRLCFIPCQTSTPKAIRYACMTICIHANNASENYLAMLERFIKKNRNVCMSYQNALALRPQNIFFAKCTEKLMLGVRKLVFS